MGIFSGIFGDSEKESKSEINVVNVYENKNNPQGRKIAGDAVLQLYEVKKCYSGYISTITNSFTAHFFI